MERRIRKMKYRRLFSPVKIRDLELKNRVVMSALNHIYTPEGYATDRFNEYYWRRAEGGVGLIIVGGCRFEEYGGTYSMISLADDRFIPGFREFTDGVHERGGKVGVQLFHAGRYAHPSANEGRQPLAPSPVYSGYSRATPREMTKEEIAEVKKGYAAAAVRAKKAGFDMVEILGSAGYLICQFLSPFTNERTDEYGGSWENRVRFAVELVSEMREAVGDYPIGMRIAGHDLVPGSNTDEDAVRFAVEMEKAGVDVLNVTGGWHESKVPQITGDLPRGGFDFIAAEIKDAVSIPVICGNRMGDPMVAERTIATECADLVSLARPHIADPDWCVKAESGNERLIRRCMACNQGCLANAFFDKPIECLVNAEAGREYLVKDLPAAGEKKKILVIGGGPAGCEFALRAAGRGHDVTIWEKAERPGGQLALAAVPPGKAEFLSLTAYYEAALESAGVSIVYGKEASADDVRTEGADITVVAAGRGEAKKIPLDTDGSAEVVSAYDVLAGETVCGRNVLVIGGGSVGCETAQFLAHDGSLSEDQVYHMLEFGYIAPERVIDMMNSSRRNISIVDIVKIGSGFKLGTGWPVIGDMKRLGVKSIPFGSVVRIRDGAAVIEAKAAKDSDELKTVEVPVDTVVMAVGALPADGLFEELAAGGAEVYNIGDSSGIGDVKAAIAGACALAEKLAAEGIA